MLVDSTATNPALRLHLVANCGHGKQAHGINDVDSCSFRRRWRVDAPPDVTPLRQQHANPFSKTQAAPGSMTVCLRPLRQDPIFLGSGVTKCGPGGLCNNAKVQSE